MDYCKHKINLICGHYGVGKTNFCLNLAARFSAESLKTALIDLDLVNPYFRSSDYKAVLEQQGATVIAPEFAGTTLDVPSISPKIPAVLSGDFDRVIVDLGGDDAGGTVIGSLSSHFKGLDAIMLYCINLFRPVTEKPEDAVTILREIEHATGLKASGLINNSHLGEFTAAGDIVSGAAYADSVSRLSGLPVTATTLPKEMTDEPSLCDIKNPFPIDIIVKTPWR